MCANGFCDVVDQFTIILAMPASCHDAFNAVWCEYAFWRVSLYDQLDHFSYIRTCHHGLTPAVIGWGSSTIDIAATLDVSGLHAVAGGLWRIEGCAFRILTCDIQHNIGDRGFCASDLILDNARELP